MVDLSLTDYADDQLRRLVEFLRGHGGFNPFVPCELCKLKDDIRAELERRESSGE